MFTVNPASGEQFVHTAVRIFTELIYILYTHRIMHVIYYEYMRALLLITHTFAAAAAFPVVATEGRI